MKNRKKDFVNGAFISALAILMIIAWFSYRNTAAMIESDKSEDHAYTVIQALDKLFSALQDVETGQRGYIITGDETYLKPYSSALNNIAGELASLRSLAKDNPQEQIRLNALKALIDKKISEVNEGIELRRSKGIEAAFRFVSTDKGQMLMAAIRKSVADDEAKQRGFLRSRAEEKAADARRSIQTAAAGSGLSFLLLFIAFTALKKELAQRVIAENELLLHRKHLQEMVEDRTNALGRANALLQNEIAEHKKAEQALVRARDELERRVIERTAELAQTVTVLHGEVLQRSNAEQILRERSDQLQLLASELTMAEQRERERLARVLHDGLQQILVGAKYWLALIDHEKDTRKITAELANLLDDAIETSRSLTAELSPPVLNQGSFVKALEWLAVWVRDRYGLTVNLISREPIESPPEEVKVFLFQAVRELLFNVVKHAGVNAALIQTEQQECEIQIVVSDQGNGFNPAGLRTAGGSVGGFGLFSLKERFSHLGGRMEISSSPGHGSRITLCAPLSLTALRTGPTSAEKKENASVIPIRQANHDRVEKRIRIVLVDDHIIARRGLSGMLGEQPDMQVVGEASDGQSALDTVRRVQPEVVIMDIDLPDMSGIEVTRIIHGELPQVRVVGLSMHDDKQHAVAIRMAGAVDYVAKSRPSETILAAIRACISDRDGMQGGSPAQV